MILPLRNKPRPAAVLNSTEPLAKGLVCASLMNEPGRASANFGRSGLLAGALGVGGLETNITAAHEPWYNEFGSGYTLCLWHSGIALASWEALLAIGDSTLSWQRYSSSDYFKNYHNGSGATMSNFLLSEIADPGMLACLWDGSEMRAYVDAVEVGNVAMYAVPKTDSTTSTLTIGGSCTVYLFLMYDRALSANEIQRLYRDPLALFVPAGFWPPALVPGGSTQDLAGSIAAVAGLSATARAVRTMLGSTGGATSLTATLHSDRDISGTCVVQTTANATLSKVGEVMLSGSAPAVSSLSASLAVWNSTIGAVRRRAWMAGALFNGMTPSAHKLGTILTGGWFWMRRAGCSAIYRGPTLAQVDFDNILAVTRHDATTVSPPAHIPHGPNSSYCYVVRRFNSCGDTEQTVSAAAMVRFDKDGDLAIGAPNAVLNLKAGQVAGNRIRLAWSYSPLDQEVAPEVFRIYWDGVTGQTDLTQALAEIPYHGRKRYSYQSDALNEGAYTFVVRARSEEQIEDVAFQSLSCSIKTLLPEAATLLAAETLP
jgi:hypothetical protein